MKRLDNPVATFLEFACWDHHVHGKGDHRMYDRAAQRHLAHYPEISRDSLYTAVVCGDLQQVEKILAERPEAAREAGGPRGWTPLLYLCFTRFSHQPAIDNALAIARVLLDCGANPNDFYRAGDVPYTALVGAAGEGEQDSPRQPYAADLFQLLLERGAEPFDIQVLYNTHFSGDMLWWLELIYAHSLKTGREAAWADPSWSMLGMGGYGPGAHFILNVAIEKNDLELARWALSHGAGPGPHQSTHPKFKPNLTLYERAALEGLTEMADLLERYGATPSTPVLDDEWGFVSACFHLDRPSAQAYVEKDPELLQSTGAMFEAAKRDRADVVEFLLDLGVPLEVQDKTNSRTLHHAAAHNALRVAALLIDRGAEIDPRETCWGGTPISWASHGDRFEMIEFLSRYTNNVWTLAFRGYVERLREVLTAEPERAKLATDDGITPLWWLPDDEARALEIVELFLMHGADPSLRSKGGNTAADWAAKRGMLEVEAKLEAAAALRAPLEDATPSEMPNERLEQYESLARDLVLAYDSGYAPALQRLCEYYGRSLTWEELRGAVRERLRAVPETEKIKDGMYEGYFAMPHALLLIARQEGFEDWAAFTKSLDPEKSHP